MSGQRCPFCASKLDLEKIIKIFNESFVLGGSCRVEAERDYIMITSSDGMSRRERATILMREMTRLDEPELFPGKRVKRLEPSVFYSKKAKLFVYYKEHCEDGAFRACRQSAKELGMTQNEYWSSLAYLRK